MVVVTVYEFDTPVAANEFDVYQTGDAIATAAALGGQPFDADDRVNEARGALLAQPQATVGLYAYVFGSRAVQVMASTSGAGQGEYVLRAVYDFGWRTYLKVLAAPPSTGGILGAARARSTELPVRIEFQAAPTLEGLAASYPGVTDPCRLLPRAAVEAALGPEVRERPVGMLGSDLTGDQCLWFVPGQDSAVAGLKLITERHTPDVAASFEEGRTAAGGGTTITGVGETAYRASTDRSTHAAAIKDGVIVMVLAPNEGGSGLDLTDVEALLRAATLPSE